MSAIDDIIAQIPLSQLAGQLGVDEQTAEQATRAALPALLGGMQANAQDPGGAQSLFEALGQHSTGLVDGGVDLDKVDTDDGSKIVNHVFGDQKTEVVNTLGGLGSVGKGLIAKLLPLLAPIVMSYLAKKLGAKLGGGSEEPQQQPQAQGGGGLGDLLGGLLGGSGGGLGNLGDLLGGLLGGGRK
ncbi:MAG TPA: DUF937 domain-containing protein [Actinokineospora sp.]|jgi:hypothetical protein|nr:DUF937 domain-containing protein [Actinokineospora sp.]